MVNERQILSQFLDEIDRSPDFEDQVIAFLEEVRRGTSSSVDTARDRTIDKYIGRLNEQKRHKESGEVPKKLSRRPNGTKGKRKKRISVER